MEYWTFSTGTQKLWFFFFVEISWTFSFVHNRYLRDQFKAIQMITKMAVPDLRKRREKKKKWKRTLSRLGRNTILSLRYVLGLSYTFFSNSSRTKFMRNTRKYIHRNTVPILKLFDDDCSVSFATIFGCVFERHHYRREMLERRIIIITLVLECHTAQRSRALQ